ncbi:MAG TPA: hypothetical protein VFV01_15700 [Spirillospora sp.]|nr:hypothetical protein [Spirillospora sp.]
MSRRGKTVKASLAAAALGAAMLLAPTAAHADVDVIHQSVDFDYLSADRIVTVTVKVQSRAGITGVDAEVRNPTTAEPYMTLPLKLVDGTDKDGTWQVRFRADTENHPGRNVVKMLLHAADGTTETALGLFTDCYPTSFADFQYGPKAVDIEHSDVTFRGRVLVQKSRDVAPEPAGGVTVQAESGETRTNVDGTYEMTVTGAPTMVKVPRQGTLCGNSQPAGYEVAMQATETSGRVVSVQPTADGATVSVHALVLRHGSGGLVPAEGVAVTPVIDNGTSPEFTPAWARTGADGTVDLTFPAPYSGRLSLRASDTFFLTGGSADLGQLDIWKTARIGDLAVSPRPVGYGAPLKVSGLLSGDWGPMAAKPLLLEFSADGRTWTRIGTATSTATGAFSFGTTATKKDGYWRARYAGDALYKPAVSASAYVDVRYGTSIAGFNASPEPVKKGKTLTVKGQLFRFMDKKLPGPNAPVSIYFQAKGSSKWSQVAVVKTASTGWFSKTFKASQDGTWMASYNGSAGYLASNKPTDYVDVQ